MALEGNYFLDGMDMYLNFSLFVESGTDGFLQYPPKKDSITHDWMDSNGKDVDLTKIFFNGRTITLACAIHVKKTTAVTDFFLKYNALLTVLAQPGTRTFQAKRLGDNIYHVFYKEANNFRMYTPLTNDPTKVACKFNLVLEEPEPKVDPVVFAVVDDDNKIVIL